MAFPDVSDKLANSSESSFWPSQKTIFKILELFSECNVHREAFCHTTSLKIRFLFSFKTRDFSRILPERFNEPAHEIMVLIT